jgi:hypothetical protein
MAPQDATQQAPGTDAAPAAEQEQGYTICIQVAGDGSLSVGVENEAAEAQAAPEGEEAAESAGFRPASDIKDALTQVLAIYRAQGAPTAESEFDKGFTGDAQ